MSDDLIIAGGNGTPGQVYLRDGAGDVRVVMRAGPPPPNQVTVVLGKETIFFDAERGHAYIKMHDGQGAIALDGATGFYVRDHAGKVVLNFAGEANMTGKPAGLWIGRAKQDGGGPGLLVIRDASGNDAIVVDGARGDIVLANADCAEDFDVAPSALVEPGTVVTLDEEGRLRPSDKPYDTKVAGVISGAGDCKPGLVLDRAAPCRDRRPVALVGKVYCKADADPAPIQLGDLLTTSFTLGHAMKASDPQKAFGAVIGKAMRSMNEGHGLIPILVALQ